MEPKVNSKMKKFLLVMNCIFLAIGNCGGPLISRLYFIKGGKRIWLSSWLQTSAWPIILIPLAISYFNRCKSQGKISTTVENNNNNDNNNNTKFILMTPRIFIAAVGMGILSGIDNYLSAYGVAKLPVSTSALLIASQLAFTAGFAFLLVKQKFSAYSINSIYLLTLGAVVLALHAKSDRPKGESKKEYILGFVLTLGAAALYGLILPLFELLYKKAKQTITYTLVLEIQAVYCFFATVVCTIGMIINKDFQAMSREAKAFELGEGRYYIVIVWSAIIWQCFFLGAIGVVYSSSSLVSAILITVLLPVTEVLAVIFYGEKFTAEKGVSLALSMWGFISYFYGDIKASKKTENQSTDD
ncbi:purine permease 3-like isoform X1 [Nicotiana tomentosiformis]|uniref:purine permease 3-like isoform X1 n=1 Tax=Nicotiana tomentosiformis TaxID=4098 RepID=UPI00051B03CB|nr:purine permease 3-like [Nicotiana tomentosiformis]